MIKGYLYKISNTINSKFYIGLTIRTIQERWKQHIDSTNNPNSKDYNCKIHNAIRELGIENFHVEQVEEVVAESEGALYQELGKRERYWIAKYDSFKNGYNGSEGGEGLPRPVKAKNISTSEIIYYPSASEAERQTGMYQSSITQCCKGKQKTLRNSHGDIYQFAYEDEEFPSLENFNSSRERPVKARNIETGEITHYSSAHEAERQTGVNNSYITQCCKGKQKTVGNSNGDIYQFAYEDEEFPSLENYNDARPRAVIATDLATGVETEYLSAMEAERQIGISHSSIIACCKGKRQTAGGCTWRYKYPRNN